jgi:phage N-6-adenine-methyltransferase
MDAVHYSTGKDDWATPPSIYAALDKEFVFGLDAAANRTNHQCYYWLGPNSCYPDALDVVDWGEAFNDCKVNVWLNPPYSRGLQGRFIAKAAEQSRLGHTVVMLLPARTDTIAFHTHIYNQPNVEIRFLKGRIKFVGAKHGAPFPSMVVIFRPT